MGLSATSSCGPADLTSLFQIASHEAKKSRAQNRIFRVVSSVGITFCVSVHVFVCCLLIMMILSCL